jgi:DNA-directed RNA polymerase subunit N (RpoN/RPB10)
VRFKPINENWKKYKNVQDDTNNQQQRDEIEERYCCLTGFIQTKMKELELTGAPEFNITTEPSVKVRLPQLSIPQLRGNLQDWVHI